MYHVTLRGNHRQDIFLTPADRLLLSDLIADVVTRFGARLHAYCFMTNHIHALIQVADTPLGQLILRIAGQYARTVQARLHTTGHLFEKRYYPVLVDADNYLLELLRYMHLNPVRARMVCSPDDYPWSSHHAYLGRRSEPWVTTDFALSLLHGDRDQAIRAYQQFVLEQTGRGGAALPFAECNPNDRRVLGSDAFAARMLGQSWRPRSHKTLDQIIEEACIKFAVSAAALASPARASSLVHARAWITHQATTDRVASIAAVARRLNRDESSLRHALRQHFR